MKVNHACILLWTFMLISLSATSQSYLGLSLNVGNSLKYSPSSAGIDSPPMPSGSIEFNFRQNLKNNWALSFGANAGIIGYSIRVHEIDTLEPRNHDKYPFPEYSTFYGGLSIVAGKDISLWKRKLFLGVGGGFGYTYSGWWSSYDVLALYPGTSSLTSIFHAETEAIDRFNTHVKVVAQFRMNSLITLGLVYNYHFSSILEGHYVFYHTKEPVSGQISLHQSELSLVCLFRISKAKSGGIKAINSNFSPHNRMVPSQTSF